MIFAGHMIRPKNDEHALRYSICCIYFHSIYFHFMWWSETISLYNKVTDFFLFILCIRVLIESFFFLLFWLNCLALTQYVFGKTDFPVINIWIWFGVSIDRDKSSINLPSFIIATNTTPNEACSDYGRIMQIFLIGIHEKRP